MVPAFLIFESLSVNGQIKEPRPIVSFQGTMTYAAVNAHNKVELGRQDDLYSLFYIILEFIKGISFFSFYGPESASTWPLGSVFR